MSGADEGIDFSRPFSIHFDLLIGLSNTRRPTQRRLSNMDHMYFDNEVYQKMLDAGDPVVYEFYELGLPHDAGDIGFGTTIVYPGKVGNEYFMTKGHFHNVLDTAEVYICLRGQGFMLLENPEGDWSAQELLPGKSVYCAKRYAHRTINVGKEPLVTFFAFRADAGHDYGTIEKNGYRKLIIEVNGKPTIVDNPKWR